DADEIYGRLDDAQDDRKWHQKGPPDQHQPQQQSPPLPLSMNGDDNHNSGMGVRRQAPPAREMETVFRISNCTVKTQIKFATCTLLESALTWWNSHIKTVGLAVAYAMTYTNLKKKMTDKYYPRGEIKKLEVEFVESKELDKIERYIGGLPDMIHRSVMTSKPKTMQDVIEFTIELMDKKISTFAER
nr:hypothetical protein [Tanacetum cinerariifolium]